VTHDGAVEAAVAMLEAALADGQLLDRQKLLGSPPCSAGSCRFSTMQVNG